MIGIIGGSGFYSYLDEYRTESIETPFGRVKIDIGKKMGQEVCFIPRHGRDHSILPSNINYRANIYAALKLEVEFILATNAVGSMNLDIKSGQFALPDQVLDFTHGRVSTFFDGSGFSVRAHNGEILEGVVHTDVTNPFSSEIRSKLFEAGKKIGEHIHDGGTIVVANGPRFETPAEIKAYKILGGDFAGMTTSPEVFLANELKIPYATLAVVTNLAAGLQSEITHEEVSELFSQRIGDLKALFSEVISTQE